MRVIAIERGYDGVVMREPGDAFDMPTGAKGTWFVEANDKGEPIKPLEVKVRRGMPVPGAGPVPGSMAAAVSGEPTTLSAAQKAIKAGPV